MGDALCVCVCTCLGVFTAFAQHNLVLPVRKKQVRYKVRVVGRGTEKKERE